MIDFVFSSIFIHLLRDFCCFSPYSPFVCLYSTSIQSIEYYISFLISNEYSIQTVINNKSLRFSGMQKYDYLHPNISVWKRCMHRRKKFERGRREWMGIAIDIHMWIVYVAATRWRLLQIRTHIRVYCEHGRISKSSCCCFEARKCKHSTGIRSRLQFIAVDGRESFVLRGFASIRFSIEFVVVICPQLNFISFSFQFNYLISYLAFASIKCVRFCVCVCFERFRVKLLTCNCATAPAPSLAQQHKEWENVSTELQCERQRKTRPAKLWKSVHCWKRARGREEKCHQCMNKL